MKKNIFLFSAVILIALAGCKSPIALIQGNPAPVKGENVIEVIFTYENMKVGNMPEEEYVKRKIGEEGEEWHKAWLQDRTDRFEPRFIELANRYTEENYGLTFERNREDTKYIAIVNTYYTEPGFYTYVRNKPAEVGIRITIAERNNPDTPIAVFDMPEIEGVVTPDVGTRITSAYRFAGRIFGSEFSKYIK